MLKYFDKNLMQQVFNSNEFKGWLLSRRWFGYKSMLSGLQFKVSVQYFEILADQFFLSIIEIEAPEYKKSYFLPLIYYDKIQSVLEQSEITKENIVKLTEITFTKNLVLTIEKEQKIITLNLLEAEYCLFFWKKILFDKLISEKFPKLSLNLTLYTEQFEDEINMQKVRSLIEASLYPDRFDLSIQQLGKGNTTNTLFSLTLKNKKEKNAKSLSYVLKSFKEFIESLEPSTLYVLVKNKFPNAPKIYGTIKIQGKDAISILENVPNKGNLGDIYWNELNTMINNVFDNIKLDYSKLTDKSEVSKIIKEYCAETLKVSDIISSYINNLHQALIFLEKEEYSLEFIDSNEYLNNYTEKFNSMIAEIQGEMSKKTENAFYNLPKINSILIDVKDVIEKFRAEFTEPTIQIQPVHQDLHMEQILYDKIDDQYNFYFIDFEGDPQLSLEEKKAKFPIEKDFASFLRALSYIKFNTLLLFIEKKLIQENEFEVPEAILYGMFFRKAAKSPTDKTLEVVLQVLNNWERRMIGKILKNLDLKITLINYFYIERALHELTYEILFRPDKILVPVLGLKEIIDKS